MKTASRIRRLLYIAALIMPGSGFAQEVITLDSHVDIPFNFATPMTDPENAPYEQGSLDKMQAGGLNAAFFIVYVDQSYRNEWEYDFAQKSAMKLFDAIHRMVRRNPDRVTLVTRANDVMGAAGTGKRVALIGVENGFVIARDLKLLEKYYNLGARYMTLVHNGHNDIADSAQPKAHFGDAVEEHGGLSKFGLEVVRKMNDLGMMVDVSHASKKTMLAAATASRAPVIASHSGVRNMVDHPRNMDDEQLLALKKSGGVIQITAVDIFLKFRPHEYDEAVNKIRHELGLVSFQMERFASKNLYDRYYDRIRQEVDARWPRATVSDLVDQIDYVVKILGIDYVGIASDFDGGGGIKGWDNASETANVTAELVKRGYNEEEIQKIWGGNLLRVMAKVEQHSAK